MKGDWLMIGAIIAKKKVMSAFDAINQKDISAFLTDWKNDSVFIYPGDVSASGRFEGRIKIEKWFRNFFDHFSKIKFTVKSVTVKNIFDFIGTNVVMVDWDIAVTTSDGKEINNSGVTVINLKMGKAFLVQDYIFDTGEKFRMAWSEA
jgi:ketosteroid isomerase-like protein